MNKYGYSCSDAVAKQVKSLITFDEEVYQVLLDIMNLFKKQGYKALPVLIGRNPTLIHGAIQLVYCTKIKTDLGDNTISMSDRIASAPNADFDGKLYKSNVPNHCRR